MSQAWWFLRVVPALRKQRQEDGASQASLGYTVRPCLKMTTKNPHKNSTCKSKGVKGSPKPAFPSRCSLQLVPGADNGERCHQGATQLLA
jgi:hypothetical protein